VELVLVVVEGFNWAGGGFFPTTTFGCVPRLPVSGLAREDAIEAFLAVNLLIVYSYLENDVADYIVTDPDSIGIHLFFNKRLTVLKDSRTLARPR